MCADPAGGSQVLPASQELSRRRVLMASRRGTSVFIKPGDVLRIGTLYSPLLSQSRPVSHMITNEDNILCPEPQTDL